MTMSATTRIHAIQAPSFDMERRDLNNMNAHIQVSPAHLHISAKNSPSARIETADARKFRSKLDVKVGSCLVCK
jgi:hypothetical protein